MQRQPDQQQISAKSRGILYHFKNILTKKKLSLSQFICQIFQFQKEKFNRTDFQTLIKKYDQNLVYEDIDQLFEELDDSKNGFVFFYRLKEIYQNITEKDNTTEKKKAGLTALFKDNIGNFLKRDDPTQQEVVLQVRQMFLASQDLYEIIDLFDVQKSGYLSVQNAIELLKNFQYDNSKKRRIILEYLYKTKSKISIQDFIEKLGLNVSAKRVDISKIKNPQTLSKPMLSTIKQQQSFSADSEPNNTIDYDMKSQFVKSKIRESAIMEEQNDLTLTLLKSVSFEDSFVPINQIPDQLKDYYNYGSVLEPEFSFFAAEYLKKKRIFLDNQNPKYSKAFRWIHAQELGNYKIFNVSESVLVRDPNRRGLGQMLESKDIIQGRLGDCYFLSAISAIVQTYPELVYRLFVLDKNQSHLYGVRLFIDGVWKTIVVDALFPISKDNRLCAAQSYKGQIWVMLLEKAWAKVFGSYDQIHSGYNQQGLTAMAGAPSVHTSSRQEGFLKKIQAHLKKGSIITCATSGQVQQLTEAQQNQRGIYSNHAYTLLSIYPNLPYNGKNSLTLLRVRNPWGKKQWKGDWSYYSSKWTKELKQITKSQHDPKDGSFFMSYDDFAVFFDFVNICQVNLSYLNSTISITADRNQFKVIRMKVKQKGDYFFTQYQENPRKYKNSFNYKKSKSWMFLSKIDSKDRSKRTAVGSHTTQYRDNTVEATLEQGQYLIISKISWRYWQSHEYNLTSYGPNTISFELDEKNKYNYINQISSFIASKSELGFGNVSFYENNGTPLEITKRLYFDAVQGYAFFQIDNKEQKLLTTKVDFNPCKGISILPPYGLPMTLEIFPNQKIIVKFIVDPSGYAYKYRQNYFLAYK